MISSISNTSCQPTTQAPPPRMVMLALILLPREGRVVVEGMETTDEERLYDIRQTVGMVFQNPDNQIVATIVEEDVAFALTPRLMPSSTRGLSGSSL